MSTLVQRLAEAYDREVSLRWPSNLSKAERVWMVIYPPSEERRVRLHKAEFELATKRAGHGWLEIDLSHAFGKWLISHEYREAYFEEPDELGPALEIDFPRDIVKAICSQAHDANVDANTVVALTGVSGLFGIGSVSELVVQLQEAISGRLLVFFPGSHEGNNYRFLDARDGWNYLARPIVATETAP
ncbi:hypothetical protein [Nonomuraea sp. LPB2021202275-12-8]|uniref:hypothetical protein n=1 Tax=Nonomuraea sp. LPB2021202275-12-8 TaxID=3120159 RepID=UPI00300DAB01